MNKKLNGLQGIVAKYGFTAIIMGTAFLVLSTGNAYGKGKKTRILPGGVVFPNMNEAVLKNPSTLNTQKGRSLQALYTPPIDTPTDLHSYSLTFASSSKDFGVGAGYQGTYLDPDMTHGMFIGGGVSLDALGIGVALRETDLEDTTSAVMDAGFLYAFDKSFQVGLVVKDVISEQRTMTAGFGYEKRGKFNIELNVESPTFDDLGSSAYIVSLIGGVYAGRFGASFTTSYNIDTDTYSNSITGLISPSEWLDILLTVDMGTATTYTFGLTLSF